MKSSLPNYIDLFRTHPILSVDLLKDLARTSQQFCPYYKSKFLAGFADIVIGDQNFILSPDVKAGFLTRSAHPLLFSKKGLPFLYLLDEAHNLPSRIRDELSLSLDLSSLKILEKKSQELLKILPKDFFVQFMEVQYNIMEFLSTLSKYMLPESNKIISAFDLLENPQLGKQDNPMDYIQLKTDEGEFFSIYITEDKVNRFKELLDQFLSALLFIEQLLDGSDSSHHKYIHILRELQDLIYYLNKIHESMILSQENDIQFFYHKHKTQSGVLYLETYMLNISNYVHQELKGTQGTIIMSATLHPEFFYRALFNFPSDINYIQLDNFFPEEHRKTLIIKDIHTRYVDINREETIQSICRAIQTIYKSKVGRYLVFTPNLKLIEKIYSDLNINNKFKQNQDIQLEKINSGIIICALGSIFSEGINLPNLSGVIIISPGIPPPSYKNSLLLEYYRSKVDNGSKQERFDLVFKIPGFNKILQSAGRLHRKPEDKGIIFLIGERFGKKQYVDLFPSFLHPVKIIESSEINEEVQNFWKE
jgi:Rad3-related DNA helicase